jgi:subtilisin family serine protease
MKKFIFIYSILAFVTLNSFGQASINLFLRKSLESSNAAERSKPKDVLIKGDPELIRSFITSKNEKVIGVSGKIVSARISLNTIAELITMPYVKIVEANIRRVVAMNDTMRMLTRVDQVHNGNVPLNQSYDGSGVIMGIIDSGLDLTHPDFKDSLGNTRVKWLWDMTKPDSTNSPQPYGYGQEWSEADINNGLASSHTGEDQYGHGTYVTGIAASNGRAVGHFQGVAPATDLIIVGYDFSAQDAVPRLSHAVEYIFNKAQALGKPCVINASLGDYMGSHDGQDLESQYISNLIDQQSGRVVVAAAGNVGVVYPFHVGTTTTTGDTSFTWFRYNASVPGAYIAVYADTAQFRNVQFAVGADKVVPYYSFRGRTSFINVTPTINTVVTRTLIVNTKRIGIIQMYTTLNGGVYQLEVYVQPDSTSYDWRFITTGNGHYDSWSFDYEWQTLPTVAAFPDMVNYNAPDTNQSIVSGMACLDNVITVGNYYNTDRHIDYNNTVQITATDKPRQLAENSSRGPTRDNRIKPEITAPGHHIMSDAVLSFIPGLIGAQPYKVGPGGFHQTGGGTSASAPVVAGIAALYLQENPGASWSDVKGAILNCAYQDSLTWGPYPNNAWGYGKADAFGTISVCGFVSVNEASDNNAVHLYPNPTSSEFSLLIPEEIANPLVSITDIMGRKIRDVKMSGMHAIISVKDLTAGMYFVRIESSKGSCVKRFEKID